MLNKIYSTLQTSTWMDAIIVLAVFFGFIYIKLKFSHHSRHYGFADDTNSYASRKGTQGEDNLVFDLKNLGIKNSKVYILRNVYLPWMGATTEIDILILSRKGFFVIESKNYKGIVSGKQSSKLWIVRYSSGLKYKFYNPIKQNHLHVRALNWFFKRKVSAYSLVIFSENTALGKVKFKPRGFDVIVRQQFPHTFMKLWNDFPEVYTSVQVEKFYEKLLPYSQVSDDVKRKHIQSLRFKRKFM